jgi:hypothetical protein
VDTADTLLGRGVSVYLEAAPLDTAQIRDGHDDPKCWRFSRTGVEVVSCPAWSPRSKKLLTEEDARQIAANMTGFFRALLDWKAANRSSGAGVRICPGSLWRNRGRGPYAGVVDFETATLRAESRWRTGSP